MKLKQGVLTNIKRLLIYFVREHFKDLVKNLSIMGDLEILRIIKRNV